MELLSYDFVQRGLLAGVLIALSSALAGVFLLLRGFAFLGAGLSHFAFGGIAISMLLGLEPFYFTALLLLLLSNGVELLRKKGLGGDIPLAVIFSGGMALAVLIISVTGGFKENLFSYLFGNILMVSTPELIFTLFVFFLLLIFLMKSYKSLLLTSFNEEIARLKGASPELVNHLLLSLSSLVVVVSIKAVGVLLSSALLVIPSAVGLMLANSLRGSLLLSSLISLFSMLAGILLALYLDLAPGGSVVMVMVFVFILVSILKKN